MTHRNTLLTIAGSHLAMLMVAFGVAAWFLPVSVLWVLSGIGLTWALWLVIVAANRKTPRSDRLKLLVNLSHIFALPMTLILILRVYGPGVTLVATLSLYALRLLVFYAFWPVAKRGHAHHL